MCSDRLPTFDEWLAAHKRQPSRRQALWRRISQTIASWAETNGGK